MIIMILLDRTSNCTVQLVQSTDLDDSNDINDNNDTSRDDW